MSGHSKWSQIKHKKAIVDQKKSATFGKLSKAIIVTARDNPDPKTNLPLKSAIENARSFDMPNSNIERLLKKISLKREATLHELVIEAFTHDGVGIVITAITDNRNRTIGDLKTLLSKNGARLSEQGSVLWMFKKEISEYIPVTTVPINTHTAQSLESLLELLNNHDDVQGVFSNEALT